MPVEIQHPFPMRRLASVLRALGRGFRLKCCRCGGGNLLRKYLKVEPRCSTCGETYEHYRADDAPAYFTIIVVGHIVVPCILLIERLDQPPSLLFQMAVWLPVTAGLTAILLPRIKGLVLAIHWLLDLKDPPATETADFGEPNKK